LEHEQDIYSKIWRAGREMQKQAVEEQFVSRHILTLTLGLIFSLIALLVPMDILGMYHMFTVHMIQHLLLSLAAPPLFILSIPPAYLRQFLGRHEHIARVVSFLTIPFVAAVLFNGNLWIWHAPPMLQIMMSNSGMHVFANVLYLVTGLLFWWPLLNPTQDAKRALSPGGKLAYLFFSDMPMMLLGAGMTFSGPLYSFDMTNPTMHMVVTAEDQQLGGLLMWIVGSIFFIILASIFFLRWMLQQEKAQQAREMEQDSEEEEEYDDEEEEEGRMPGDLHTPHQGHRA
jgi:cytochrome c oxidase assembly factor CtaG